MRTALLLILTAVFIMVAPFAAGQQPIVLYLFIDSSSLTIYIPDGGFVSLDNIIFQAGEEPFPLSRYTSGLVNDLGNVPTPICLRFEQFESQAPLPLECTGVTTAVRGVSNANVFWFDGGGTRQTRTITLMRGSETLGICPSANPRCPFSNFSLERVPNEAVDSAPLIAPAAPGEILIVLATFEQLDDADIQPALQFAEILNGRMDSARRSGVNVRIARLDEVITTQEHAKDLRVETGATMVIWGQIDSNSLRTHYEIAAPAGREIRTRVDETHFTAEIPIAELTRYIEEADEQTYVANFTIGQLYFYDAQYDEAIPFFEAAIAQMTDKSEDLQRAVNMGVAYLYLGRSLQDAVPAHLNPNLERAAQAYRTAIEYFEPDQLIYATAHNYLANASYYLFITSSAASDRVMWLETSLWAIEVAVRFEDVPIFYAESLLVRGQLYIEAGQIELGCTDFRVALPILRDNQHEVTAGVQQTIEVICDSRPTQLSPPVQRGSAIIGTRRGEVEPWGSDEWTFSGCEGEVLAIRVNADFPANDAPDRTGLFDPLVRVYTPNNELLAVFDDIEPDVNTDAEIRSLALPVCGTYRIEVASWANLSSGAYSFTIEMLAAP